MKIFLSVGRTFSPAQETIAITVTDYGDSVLIAGVHIVCLFLPSPFCRLTSDHIAPQGYEANQRRLVVCLSFRLVQLEVCRNSLVAAHTPFLAIC